MKRMFAGTALTLALVASNAAVGNASGTSCPGVTQPSGGVHGEGSFSPSTVEGGLPEWPAVKDIGRYRMLTLSIDCSKGEINQNVKYFLIRIGDATIGTLDGVQRLTRVGDTYIATGRAFVMGVEGSWNYELTLIDKDNAAYGAGDRPRDYLKLKMFSDDGTVVLLVKSKVWGNKITTY